MVDNKVVIKSVESNTVVTVARCTNRLLIGSVTAGNNSEIIGIMMISITRTDGNIIIVNNSINQTSTRLGKDNISNLGTDIGAVLGLVIGTEIGIDLGTKLGAALGLGLSSRLGSLLGIGFVTSM